MRATTLALAWGAGVAGVLAMPPSAVTPPRGWNSYDSYTWKVGETEFLSNCAAMATKLGPGEAATIKKLSTHSPAHSPTASLTHSLTRSSAHPLTRSLTHLHPLTRLPLTFFFSKAPEAPRGTSTAWLTTSGSRTWTPRRRVRAALAPACPRPGPHPGRLGRIIASAPHH